MAGAFGWPHVPERDSGPNPMSVWSRIEVGWITPETVTADRLNVQIHDIRHGSPCLEVDTGGTLTISNTALSDCGMISGESESSALEFPEDFMDVVDTYPASALIGNSVEWSLVDSGDDDAFVIHPQQGVLRFDPAPDFEALTEAGHDTDSNGNIVLHVRVRAVERGNQVSVDYPVTITVTNVDEPGRVELSSTEPKVGDRLTAELTDPDMGVEDVRWEWQALPPGTRSTHPPEPGASTASSLLVTSERIGLTLSAQVTYVDGESNNANDCKSAQSAATAPVVDVPSAPRNLEAAAGNARVDLRWDPPLTDNGSALTGYGYRYGSGGSWTPGTLGVTPSHTIDQLTNGTAYTFELWAVNGAGNSDPTSATATPVGVPDPPVLSVEEGDGRVRLRFVLGSDNGSGITRRDTRVYRLIDGARLWPFGELWFETAVDPPLAGRSSTERGVRGMPRWGRRAACCWTPPAYQLPRNLRLRVVTRTVIGRSTGNRIGRVKEARHR